MTFSNAAQAKLSASPSGAISTTFSSALVIDDDPLAQIVASEGLISGGVKEVDLADDGVIGIEKLMNGRKAVDLVILDLQMPNMTGVDVVRELAQAKFSGGVIILSSEDSSLLRSVRNMAKALQINILGALSKPLNVEKLHALINSYKDARPRHLQRVISRQQLMTALDNEALIPFFQPKICLADRKIAGFEVLMRHVDDAENSPAPMRYLQAIDRYGLAVDALTRMIMLAGRDIAGWSTYLDPVNLAFNLSPLAVQDAGLPDRLRGVVKRAGLAPQNVTFEITEDHLLECTATSLEVLSLMRLYGFKLSIDDFGTGATGIEQLRTFPFTELKIDGKFMLSCMDDEFSRLTIQTSAKLAGMLGMNVVAEGVETPEAIQFARDAGAHHVQGFHFARPMNGEKTLAWIEKYDADPMSSDVMGGSV